eukprot:9459786-Pyramimonas_sp.AAC.1
MASGSKPAEDPLPSCVKLIRDSVTEIINVERWVDLFDASKPCTERTKALDVILDMPATYEVLGSSLDDMKKHVYTLTEQLLTGHGKDKGFTFDDAIQHHSKYNVRAMCGALASTRNIHLGNALSVDPLVARAPYTAVSMYLLPSPCKLADKV